MIAKFTKIKEERRLKAELKKAFTVAEIYREYNGFDGKKGRIYPKIHSVRETGDSREYVFTLPTGLDPRDLTKKDYVFRQVFGDKLEFDGEIKRFTLTVYYRSLPSSAPYLRVDLPSKLSDMRLPILCGVDRYGETVSYDMAEYPHLLIAGETGSGKSTQVRSIITTLIRNVGADKLTLYMADLKRSEFHIFKRVKHVPEVMTKTAKLKSRVSKLRKEMERRGDLLDEHEVTHVDELPADKRPKYIVLCIDEVAMLQKENVIMEGIEEISAIGRALGVFLLLSMQRPDRNVLDGKLKNNLTVRMAFRHSDGINSRITIGTQDAKDISIEERGRMYLKLEDLTLIQAPYLTDKEARKLLDPYRVEREESEEYAEQPPEDGEEFMVGLIDDE
ncbi:FtsK/SpoIIIE domain-containing protein [Alteribacter populi]|uniref:FtsK/SpoIIIE domain-containing protein n=1 Tax=Alteribacter populi TaxID=2011011 RepID=UPI0012FF7FC7|nr:FtsK/SpoIIIE domain-containing protein [Alteribacter populi]